MWQPTDAKINDFGAVWRDGMLIPATTDFVLGHDDPGGVPINFTDMDTEASSRMFAELANNLQYIRNIFLFDDLTLTVNNVTTLQAAQLVIDRIGYIHKGVTLTIDITSSIPWGLTDDALTFDSIHGGGGIVVDGNTNSLILKANATHGISFVNCTCSCVVVGGLTLRVEAQIDYPFYVLNCSDVQVLQMINESIVLDGPMYYCEGSELALALCAFSTGSGTGEYSQGIHALNRSNVTVTSCTFGPFKGPYWKLDYDSDLTYNILDQGNFPSGVDHILTGNAVEVDHSSRFKVAESYGTSGSGTFSSPYVVTFVSTGVTTTLRDVMTFIRLLPNPLDVWVKLKLPAGTFNDTHERIFLEGLRGSGGLIIEANTVQATVGSSQDTILQSINTQRIVRVDDCDLSIRLNSLKLVQGVINNRSGDLRLDYPFLESATFSGVESKGNGAKTFVRGAEVGDCREDGFFADESGRISTTICRENGGTGFRPQGFGFGAEEGGVINRQSDDGTGLWDVLGDSGLYRETTGGVILDKATHKSSAAVSSAYTVSGDVHTVIGDVSGGGFTVNLPNPVQYDDMICTVLKSDASGNTLIVAGTIHMVGSYNLTAQGQAKTFHAIGGTWYVIGSHL